MFKNKKKYFPAFKMLENNLSVCLSALLHKADSLYARVSNKTALKRLLKEPWNCFEQVPVFLIFLPHYYLYCEPAPRVQWRRGGRAGRRRQCNCHHKIFTIHLSNCHFWWENLGANFFSETCELDLEANKYQCCLLAQLWPHPVDRTRFMKKTLRESPFTMRRI